MRQDVLRQVERNMQRPRTLRSVLGDLAVLYLKLWLILVFVYGVALLSLWWMYLWLL